MDREEDESRSGEPQLAADATEEQIAIYQAVLAFYRSDLESQALKEFTRPKAREYAHTIADELGIYHRSEGKGRLRHVVLAKTAPTSPSARYDVDSSTWKPCTYSFIPVLYPFQLFSAPICPKIGLFWNIVHPSLLLTSPSE